MFFATGVVSAVCMFFVTGIVNAVCIPFATGVVNAMYMPNVTLDITVVNIVLCCIVGTGVGVGVGAMSWVAVYIGIKCNDHNSMWATALWRLISGCHIGADCGAFKLWLQRGMRLL